MEITIKHDMTVRCETCNAELPADFDTRHDTLTVTPCERCLEAARDEVREELEKEEA